MFHHFTVLKLIAFAINVAVVVYLVVRIRKERSDAGSVPKHAIPAHEL